MCSTQLANNSQTDRGAPHGSVPIAADPSQSHKEPHLLQTHTEANLSLCLQPPSRGVDKQGAALLGGPTLLCVKSLTIDRFGVI